MEDTTQSGTAQPDVNTSHAWIWKYVALFVLLQIAYAWWLISRKHRNGDIAQHQQLLLQEFQATQDLYTLSTHNVEVVPVEGPLRLKFPYGVLNVGRVVRYRGTTITKFRKGEVVGRVKSTSEVKSYDDKTDRAVIESELRSVSALFLGNDGTIAGDNPEIVSYSLVNEDRTGSGSVLRHGVRVNGVAFNDNSIPVTLHLPRKEVVVGDQWEYVLPASDDHPQFVRDDPPRLTAKLVGTFLFDGQLAAQIESIVTTYVAFDESLSFEQRLNRPLVKAVEKKVYFLSIPDCDILWVESTSEVGSGATVISRFELDPSTSRSMVTAE